MDCHYINLASDTAKRKELETLFEACTPKGWTLQRFEAIDKQFVLSHDISGQISDGAKGCFLSHQHLLGQHLETQQPLFIVEDDVVFTARTFELIDQIVDKMDPQAEWDIIHTDICVPSPGAMIDFYLAKKSTAADQLSLVNLKDKFYASTAAYIVNPKSVRKIFNLLSHSGPLDQPIDLFYRFLTHSGILQSYVTVPFITSLSNRSTQTNIQKSDDAYTELIWHTYRKFSWINPSENAVKQGIEGIEQHALDPEANQLLKIISGFFRTAYKEK